MSVINPRFAEGWSFTTDIPEHVDCPDCLAGPCYRTLLQWCQRPVREGTAWQTPQYCCTASGTPEPTAFDGHPGYNRISIVPRDS